MLKLALVQMEVRGGDKLLNLSHAQEMIRKAAAGSADIVLLPEAMDVGWTHPSSATEASPIPEGDTCQMLTEAAREHGVYVCAGLIERSGDQVYNSAVIAAPTEEIILRHRKLNELDIGHSFYDQGDKLNVCHTEHGTLGLMICADAFARERVLSRSLCYMGADLILSPSAWAVEADHDNDKDPYGQTWLTAYTPVAREFSVWIAGVSNVGWISDGPWRGKKCIGCSLVIGPDGEVAASGPYGVDAETILYVDIDPVERPARGTTWIDLWQRRANE